MDVTAPSAGSPIARLAHVSLAYEDDVHALVDVSLSLRAGERVCVLGANGSGKSTLASVLCGLLAPDEGSVELAGEQVLNQGTVDFAAYRRARRTLGLVFQNPDDQLVTSIVEEDVAFGPENLGVDSQEIGRRVERELGRVAMGEYAKANPTRLSGGQKQRVAIAGALAMEPHMLVLDEPGALLDVRGRRSIMKVMSKMRDSGTTVVHITHFMEEALEADRVIVMCAGSIALDGTPSEVFAHGDELRGMGLHEPFSARLSEHLRSLGMGVPWTTDECVLAPAIARCARHLWHGGPKDENALPSAPAEAEPLSPVQKGRKGTAIEAQGVCYSYRADDVRLDARPALDGVTLSIAAGSSCAIVGQTGSGKSTLLRLICALEAPDEGSICVNGIHTTKRRERRKLHGHIGYVMQHPERQLFAETVAADVAFGPTNLHLPQEEVERRCSKALELVGLTGKEDRSPFELSGGQQRMCAIAGILAMQPDILVLDEPTAGLDPRGREELASTLADIHAHGVTVVQVTHSMEDAVRAEQVIVLNQSHVMMSGSPRQVFSPQNEERLRRAGLGLPTALEWALRLKGMGMRGLGSPLTLEELANAIAAACPTSLTEGTR